MSAGRPVELRMACFERDDLLLDGVVADLAREGAVAARVRDGVAGRLHAAVGGGRDPRLLHVDANVLLAHAEVDDLRAAVALDLEHDFDRLLPFRLGDGGDVLAVPLRVGRVAGDLDASCRRRGRRAPSRCRP